MLYFVYTIEDPTTGEVGYVGFTNNPNLRLQNHLGGKEPNSKKNTWLQQLLASNIEPKMRILEIVDGNNKQARERESYWIQYYVKQKASLTNILQMNNQVKQVKQRAKNRWLNTYQSCAFAGIHWKGTKFLYLAEEFGLNKRVVDNTTYYSSEELEKFIVWLDKHYPGLRRFENEDPHS